MPYPVQNLIEGRGEPVSVHPHNSVQEALRLMIEHDFSQLPVVDEDGKPLGMVSYESILRALSNFGVKIEDLSVSNVITTRVQKYRPDEDLFELLDRLKETNAVLIVDGDERLIGIVTSYDSTEYFRRRAEDMMLVEDIETMVKDLVQAAFMDDQGEVDQRRLTTAIEEITSSKRALIGRYRNALRHYLKLQGQTKPAVNSQSLEESFSHFALKEEPKDFEELTLYEYAELLLHKKRWDFYRPIFNLEPEALRKLLDSIREIRNALAHFRGEISPKQRDQLKFCAEWLARHQSAVPVSWPFYVVSPPKEPVVKDAAMCYEAGDLSLGEVVPTEETLGPGDSRYAPLAIHLQSQLSRQDRVQLTFDEIKEIIAGDLPSSALEHRSWWANDPVSHIQSQQWLEVGWRVSQLSITDQRVTFARIKEREAAYIDFFGTLLADLRKTTDMPITASGADGKNWLTILTLPESGPQSFYFNFSFARGRCFRVELYIDTGYKRKNKFIFDKLHKRMDEIEKPLREKLSWERMDPKRASRIAAYRPGAITDSDEELAQLHTWAVGLMPAFYEVIAGPACETLDSAQDSGLLDRLTGKRP